MAEPIEITDKAPDIIIPSKKANIIMDATILSAIMNCGRFSDLRFNHNLESGTGKSNNLEIGSMGHKILDTYYKLVIGGTLKKDAVGFALAAGELFARGCPYCTNFQPQHSNVESSFDGQTTVHTCNDNCILKPKCGHLINEYEGLRNTPEESSGYLVGSKWVMETFVQYFDYYRNDSWVPLASEVVKGKVFFEDDNIRVLFKSKLDSIVDTPNGIRPMDHKTMKQNRDILSLNNQFKGQAINTGTREVWINKIGFQKTLEPKDKFLRVPINYSLDSLIEFQSEILPYWAYKMLEYQETGYWPANYTNCDGKYGKCVFHEICEADRGMRNELLKLNFVVGKPWNPSNEGE